MKIKKLLIFSLLLFFASVEAQACTPCQTSWPMDRMLAESEVVILGSRIDKSHSSSYKEVAETFEVRIDELLKPSTELEVGEVIEVRSWYGPCPYGVQMHRYEKAIIFLNKVSDSTWFSNAVYEAATYKHALCNDEAMTLEGQNLLIWDPVVRQNVKYPLAEFRRVFLNRYAPKQQNLPQTIPNTQPFQSSPR